MKQYNIIITSILGIVFGISLCYSTAIISSLSLDSYYLLRVLFFYILSAFFIFRIHRKSQYYLPSFYLFSMFSVAPLFAIPGYYIFLKIYHTYKGGYLDVQHALEIWLQSLFFIMLGIFIVHTAWDFFARFNKSVMKRETYISWDWKRFNSLLCLLSAISLLFSVIVIVKIGYIPILKGGIEKERFFYDSYVGEWTYKLARLWLIVYFFAFIKLLRNIELDKGFYIRKNISVILLLICSVFFDNIYGDRFHLFIMFFFGIIMINKIVGKFKIFYFVSLLFIGLFSSTIISVFRTTASLTANKINIFENVVLGAFGEWREFAYTLKNFPAANFLHGKTFISVIAPMLPKSAWAVFGIDKYELLDYTSAVVMRRIFGHYAGIRIGITGESFINFGYSGVVFVSLITGVIFGILENVFLSLKNFDIKEVFFVFILAMMLFLPVSQTDVITTYFFFYCYFLIACAIFFHKKQIIDN